MSGICGIYSPRQPELASREHLERMISTIAHRGGDGEARFLDAGKGIALGQLTRSTFPRPGGRPGAGLAQSDSLVVTNDGSLSNLAELDDGRPDEQISAEAQALLRLYQKDPSSFPEGIEGYIALAAWNGDSEELVLAADPMGRKQLYFYHAAGLVVFASELKGILAHGSISKSVDADAMSLYGSLGYVPVPYTPFVGVRKVEAGRRLTFDKLGNLAKKRYWVPRPQATGSPRLEDWLEPVRSEITAALKRVTSSTPRIALFLSGGIDSSAVLAALKSLDGVDVKAFTMAFRRDRSDYDLTFARRVATATGGAHEEVTIAKKQITPELVSGLFHKFEEPIDSITKGVAHTFLLERAKENNLDSILVGSAAESCFDSMQMWGSYVAQNPDVTERNGLLRGFLSRSSLLSPDAQKNIFVEPGEEDLLTRVGENYLTGLDYLGAVEASLSVSQMRNFSSRYGMFNVVLPAHNGQEARTPFLDERLFTLTLSIPAALKGLDAPRMNKAVLNAAYGSELNVRFEEREKRPLPSFPQPRWLKEAIGHGLDAMAGTGVVQPSYARALAERYRAGQDRRIAWQLFVLHCWLEFHFFGREPLERALDGGGPVAGM